MLQKLWGKPGKMDDSLSVCTLCISLKIGKNILYDCLKPVLISKDDLWESNSLYIRQNNLFCTVSVKKKKKKRNADYFLVLLWHFQHICPFISQEKETVVLLSRRPIIATTPQECSRPRCEPGSSRTVFLQAEGSHTPPSATWSVRCQVAGGPQAQTC